MIRQNKKMILLTSILTLFPILIGVLLWKQLPDSVATNFGMDSQPNGYSSKAFSVFGLPLFLLFMHWFCLIAINTDPKSRNISKKVFGLVLWICPLVSVGICSVLYAYNLGYKIDIVFICNWIIGIFYLILGNFIPKTKPNYTVGFRVPWALNDPDNWHHTHRFGGKCLVLGGVVMILTSPLQNEWVLFALAMIPCAVPAVYSYLYYRKSIS